MSPHPHLTTAAACCVHAYAPGEPPPAGIEHLHAAELYGRIQFSLYRQGDMLIIAWAGSNEPHDWLRHTMARRRRVPAHMLPGTGAPQVALQVASASVHRGWLADADACLPTLVMLLHANTQAVTRILFTGHSYGGPLALLCALALVDRLRTDGIATSVITYGSPAPGNQAFAQIAAAHLPHTRCANPLDIVTTLPAGRYAHTGTLLPIPAGWPAHSIHRYRDWIHAQPMDLSPGIHPV